MPKRYKNRIYKTWDGRICDDANDLHHCVTSGKIYDRHNRIAPVLVTSTVWNAMQKACASYNRAVIQ